MRVITAGSPMVGTPINLVQGLIRLGLFKDLNLHQTPSCDYAQDYAQDSP